MSGMPKRFVNAALDGPGPRSWAQAAVLAAKGLAMGAADIVPGVSGGTIAFISGIYEDLINAIRSFNADFFANLLRGDVSGALRLAHVRFLVPLLFGIAAAILTVARLVHYLMEHHPVHLWSLFFGLIAASAVVVGRKLPKLTAPLVGLIAAGAVFSYVLTGLVPATTPETWWFIFLCGALAICAMILPGISGAFILLLLGKYAYITGALKNPFALESLGIISLFLVGCAFGLAGFSRLLSWLFARYHNATIAVLTGFMLGSLRKVWPWKEVLESVVIRGKVKVLAEQNLLPTGDAGHIALAAALALAGFALVLLLERFGSRQDSHSNTPPDTLPDDAPDGR